MGPILSFARVLGARAGAAALAVPMLLGGAVPASAAVASHAMVPAVGSGSRYQLIEGGVDPSGLIKFRCQLPSAPVACYGPDQIRAAYDIQPVLDQGFTGAGRTIVIIDAFQSPTLQSDLAKFDGVWNLPAPTLNVIAPDGLTPFNPTDPNMIGWSAEISLDVEWAHAIAPGATIDLVLAKSNQDADILSATEYAVDHNLGDVISQSFGEAEMCMDPALLRQQHEVFKEATDKGITLFASSGDNGAAQPTCDGASFIKSASTPASDPNVTGVGGTTLVADRKTGAYQSETVWNDGFIGGGGGFSTVFRRPGYQATAQKDSRHRGVPDVAYKADVQGGVIVAWSDFCLAIVDCSKLGGTLYFRFGGTSAGSPQWAGIIALADQKGHERLGAINGALYKIAKSEEDYSRAFHDITVGDNSCSCITPTGTTVVVQGFAAKAGWDAASGLGSPKSATLIGLLLDQGQGGGEQGGNGG